MTICLRCLLPALLLSLLFGSCTSLRESAKHKLADGAYSTRLAGTHSLVVTTIGDSIALTPLLHTSAGEVADKKATSIYPLSIDKTDNTRTPEQRLYNGSFDIDFLTILAKYRPAAGTLPPALHTTTYNGALFAGYRVDRYYLHYDDSPLGIYKRDLSHYGFSMGAFAGFGATPLSHNTTQPQIDYEYDGFTLSTGLAITAAVHNITVGIAIGQDRLLDKNHDAWIYQRKPWIGLGLGLNLN